MAGSPSSRGAGQDGFDERDRLARSSAAAQFDVARIAGQEVNRLCLIARVLDGHGLEHALESARKMDVNVAGLGVVLEVAAQPTKAFAGAGSGRPFTIFEGAITGLAERRH